MGQPVVHFEIGGRDGEQLQGFYAGALRLEFNRG